MRLWITKWTFKKSIKPKVLTLIKPSNWFRDNFYCVIISPAKKTLSLTRSRRASSYPSFSVRRIYYSNAFNDHHPSSSVACRLHSHDSVHQQCQQYFGTRFFSPKKYHAFSIQIHRDTGYNLGIKTSLSRVSVSKMYLMLSLYRLSKKLYIQNM